MCVAVDFAIGCLGALNLTCFLHLFLGRVFLLASKRVTWPCVLILASATEKLAGILGFSWALCIAPNNSTRCEWQSIREELQNASLGLLLNTSFLVPISFLLNLPSKTRLLFLSSPHRRASSRGGAEPFFSRVPSHATNDP